MELVRYENTDSS